MSLVVGLSGYEFDYRSKMLDILVKMPGGEIKWPLNHGM
jgi:hypothetical protein